MAGEAGIVTMNNTTRLAQIDDVLGGIPEFKCVEGCSDCCGPVPMTRLEWLRLVKLTGQNDKQLESKFYEGFRAGLSADESYYHAHARCALLDKATNKCTVYEARPAICQLFGDVEHERMVCPHGRRPEVKLTHEQAGAILDQVMALGHGPKFKLPNLA